MRCLIDHPIEPYFPYIAVAPWPCDPRLYQTDWVDSVATLESWLTAYVGRHYTHWVYATRSEQEYWQACVGFARAQDCTLFVLRWAN